MKKIDSSLLVCSAAISQQLIGLGILPVACHCYEATAGNWEFSGEYVGQHPVLPAFTMEEVNILIGGDYPKVIRVNKQTIVQYPKPDLHRTEEWSQAANMMTYVLFLPDKRSATLNGAEAYAKLLYELLVTREIKPEECNARLEAFVTKSFFNPLTEALANKNKPK